MTPILASASRTRPQLPRSLPLALVSSFFLLAQLCLVTPWGSFERHRQAQMSLPLAAAPLLHRRTRRRPLHRVEPQQHPTMSAAPAAHRRPTTMARRLRPRPSTRTSSNSSSRTRTSARGWNRSRRTFRTSTRPTRLRCRPSIPARSGRTGPSRGSSTSWTTP
jgi:hypothetical protein